MKNVVAIWRVAKLLMNNKYTKEEIGQLANGEISFQDFATKHNIKISTVHSVLYYHKYYKRNRLYKITSPYKTIICSSVREVSEKLGLCDHTVYKALKGGRVRVLEELEIKVEVIENGKKEIIRGR